MLMWPLVNKVIHHDAVPSASSVEKQRQYELMQMLLVWKMTDFWSEMGYTVLNSFDEKLSLPSCVLHLISDFLMVL